MRAHLGEVIREQVPVSLVSREGYFDSCTLVMGDAEEGLGLLVRHGKALFEDGEPLSVSYSYKAHIYVFETGVKSLKSMPGETVLSIGLPERILRLERRKSLRVEPAALEPVGIAVSTDRESLFSTALDISSHGASFSLPEPARFAPGSPISMSFDLPRFGKFSKEGMVRSVNPAGADSIKYGVEFETAEEFDSPIAQYARWRRIEAKAEKKVADPPVRSVLLAIRESDQGRQAYFCTMSPVREIQEFGAFSQIISADVIDALEDKR